MLRIVSSLFLVLCLFLSQVVWLDPKEKKVVLNNGNEVTFDKCLIATGKVGETFCFV